jgi:hypothetical protein
MIGTRTKAALQAFKAAGVVLDNLTNIADVQAKAKPLILSVLPNSPLKSCDSLCKCVCRI